MTINVYSQVQALLDAQLQTVDGLPTFFPEDKTVKSDSANTPWCRAVLLPSKAIVQSLGSSGTMQYQGIYQIDLYYPAGYGWADSRTNKSVMADTVIQAFPWTEQLTDNSIWLNISSVYRNPALNDLQSKYYRLSVSVEWWTLVSA
jgi:hypothetical protein